MRGILALATIIMVINGYQRAYAFCFAEAGEMYGISPQLLWVISKGESSHNPSAVGWNKNGSYDYGLMQINTIWEPVLKKHGISWDSLADPCTNVKVGAWILAKCFKDYGYTWAGVGCYNSRTPYHRNRYANRVAQILQATQKRATIRSAANASTVQAITAADQQKTPWEQVFPDDN